MNCPVTGNNSFIPSGIFWASTLIPVVVSPMFLALLAEFVVIYLLFLGKSRWSSTPYSVDVNPNPFFIPVRFVGYYPVFGSCKSYLFSPSRGNLCGSFWLMVDFVVFYLVFGSCKSYVVVVSLSESVLSCG